MTRTASLRAAASAALLAVVVACVPGGDPELSVGRAQAAEPVAGASQILVEVTNAGDGPDRMIGAETPVALGVEIHLTEIVDGRATMSEIDRVEIAPGETVRFRPGGLHLMMIVPDESVRVGGTFELTLRFERSGEVTVPVEVVDLLDLAEGGLDEPSSGEDSDHQHPDEDGA